MYWQLIKKLLGYVAYRLARRFATFQRNLYVANLKKICSYFVLPKAVNTVDISVYSLCGQMQLPEQVASICSFLTHVGIPTSFCVISDGSLTCADMEMLHSLHPVLNIISRSEILDVDLPDCVKAYVKTGQPMGFKLASLLFISARTPSLYFDSDVLFFPGAINCLETLISGAGAIYYMSDLRGSLDERLLEDDDYSLHAVNGGFLCFKYPVDWTKGLARLQRLNAPPVFFTEQTITHLTVQQNGGTPLDATRFILQTEDRCRAREGMLHRRRVLRHYVTPVRYKFWLQVPVLRSLASAIIKPQTRRRI